jgi:hypothetical protein
MIMGFWSLEQPDSHDHEARRRTAGRAASTITTVIMAGWSLEQPEAHDHERRAGW